jgi:hypothetical protein
MITNLVHSCCHSPENRHVFVTLQVLEVAISVAGLVIGILALCHGVKLPIAVSYPLLTGGGLWVISHVVAYVVIASVRCYKSRAQQNPPENTPINTPQEPKIEVKRQDIPENTPIDTPKEIEVTPQKPPMNPPIDTPQATTIEVEPQKPPVNPPSVVEAPLNMPPVIAESPYAATLKQASIWIDQCKDHEVQEELRADFDYVVNQDTDLSPQKKTEILNKMEESLPYLLGLKENTPSEFPRVGIPNHTGNQCYLNASLQALAHSRFSDYFLWCPLRKSSSELGPEPTPPNTQPVKMNTDVPDWKEKLQAENKANIDAAARYKLAKEKWDVQKAVHDPANYQRAKEIQKEMRERVLQLRQGQLPSQQQMRQLARLLFPLQDANAPGNHELVLSTLCVAAPGLPIDKFDDLKKLWPVLILGSGTHYKAIIHHKDGFFQINDSFVTRLNDNQKNVVADVEADRQKYQPYMLIMGRRQGYFLNT